MLKSFSVRLTSFCGLAATTWVLLGLLAFGALDGGYSHLRHTISELGAYGSPNCLAVSYGVFLPVGLLLWLMAALAYLNLADERLAVIVLIGILAIGSGYVAAAFFPCDPGSPLFGSRRQLVHNLFGFIEYFGSGIGLIVLGFVLGKTVKLGLRLALYLSGLTVLACLCLLSFPGTFGVRGLVQRIAEILLFGWLNYASLLVILGKFKEK